MTQTQVRFARATTLLTELTRHPRSAKAQRDAKEFLHNESKGKHPTVRKFHVRVTRSRHDLPAFGAYVSPTIRLTHKNKNFGSTGQVLLNLDAILWACTDHKDLHWSEFAAETVTHELVHVLQDMFKKRLGEKNLDAAIARARKECGPGRHH